MRSAASTSKISIHALREEGDPAISCIPSQFDVFQSTPSARRATCRPGRHHPQSDISIHALREEGDQ